jgi:3-oxoacyl-[acyl-carrier protein] reductase
MSKELAPEGILVNAVAPGRIDTPFHEEFTPDEKREEAKEGILLGREGTAEEVVGAVLFLASSYSSYVLGEVLEVGGGIS